MATQLNPPGKSKYITYLAAGLFSAGVSWMILFPEWFGYWLTIYRFPGFLFLDMHCLCAAVEANALGMPVFGGNMFDYIGRGHNYPATWFVLEYLGANRDTELMWGWATNTLFIIGFTLLLRPTTWGQLLIFLLLAFSPPIILGIERANIDLIVWLIAVGGVALMAKKEMGWIIVGAVLVYASVTLKVYPAVAVLAFLPLLVERPRFALIGMVVFTAAVVAFGLSHLGVLQKINATAPDPLLWYSINSDEIFRLAQLSPSIADLLAKGIIVLIVVVSLFVTARMKDADYLPDNKALVMQFLMGAGVLVFCYFMRGSYSYRLIFIAPCIPFLLAAYQIAQAKASQMRGALRIILALSVYAFFADLVIFHVLNPRVPITSPEAKAPLNAILIARDLGYWFLMALLIFFITGLCWRYGEALPIVARVRDAMRGIQFSRGSELESDGEPFESNT